MTTRMSLEWVVTSGRTPSRHFDEATTDQSSRRAARSTTLVRRCMPSVPTSSVRTRLFRWCTRLRRCCLTRRRSSTCGSVPASSAQPSSHTSLCLRRSSKHPGRGSTCMQLCSRRAGRARPARSCASPTPSARPTGGCRCWRKAWEGCGSSRRLAASPSLGWRALALTLTPQL